MLCVTYGLPKQIVSDGPPFQSAEYEEFLRQNGIQRILVSPYHPSSNGLAERFVQTFKHSLDSSASDPAENSELPVVLQKHPACHNRLVPSQAVPTKRTAYTSLSSETRPCHSCMSPVSKKR